MPLLIPASYRSRHRRRTQARHLSELIAMSLSILPNVSQWLRRSSPSPIMTLPTELLCAIAAEIPTRHATNGYVVESANLASFRAVNRLFNTIALLLLFKEVTITSEHQLQTLESASEDLLDRIR